MTKPRKYKTKKTTSITVWPATLNYYTFELEKDETSWENFLFQSKKFKQEKGFWLKDKVGEFRFYASKTFWPAHSLCRSRNMCLM